MDLSRRDAFRPCSRDSSGDKVNFVLLAKKNKPSFVLLAKKESLDYDPCRSLSQNLISLTFLV